MPYTTLTVRHDTAKRLRQSKAVGESYSDVLERLLDNQPAACVEEWLESLAPLEGRTLFTEEQQERLKSDQKKHRDSKARRRGHAPV
jgi:predicted CopG family antitoxin